MLYILIIVTIIIVALYIYFRHSFYAYFDKQFIVEQRSYPKVDFSFKPEEVYLKSSDNMSIFCLKAFPKNYNAVVILVHGWGVSHQIFTSLIEFLYKNDFATLSVDLRSRGKSEGNYVGAGYLEQADVCAAIKYTREISNVPIVTIGSSMGGATVLSVEESVDAIIAIAPYSNFFNMVKYMEVKKPSVIKSILAKHYENTYLRRRIGIVDFTTPYERVMKYDNKPILLVHSKRDQKVPYNESLLLMESLKNNSSAKLITLEGSNHTPWIIDSDIRKFDEDIGKLLVNYINENILPK